MTVPPSLVDFIMCGLIALVAAIMYRATKGRLQR